ncbi:hypothetical protein LFL96_10480 [Paraburkholderia sp. D15]|uniref:hypothetical protein n=1 Tax=Paraburkholderia sp. D15 TaxID=2880218 RepID=UPI0024792D14|nr:hypothetical protein [Paraburkholderia sp. D15]WGS48234.1 hypothetical protein LFL96_10480 [Paraburkholderia sp. D15]
MPIIGPIFTLGLVALARDWRAANVLIAASVKNGQLFWCATGLCASAIYEGLTALERGSTNLPMLAVSMTGSCLLGFACSVTVMIGLLDMNDQQTDSFSRGAIRVSIFAVTLAAILLAFLHGYLNLGFPG